MDAQKEQVYFPNLLITLRRYASNSASLAFVRGIHRGPVNSPHKWPVARNMFPFDYAIMICIPNIRVLLIQLLKLFDQAETFGYFTLKWPMGQLPVMATHIHHIPQWWQQPSPIPTQTQTQTQTAGRMNRSKIIPISTENWKCGEWTGGRTMIPISMSKLRISHLDTPACQNIDFFFHLSAIPKSKLTENLMDGRTHKIKTIFIGINVCRGWVIWIYHHAKFYDISSKFCQHMYRNLKMW